MKNLIKIKTAVLIILLQIIYCIRIRQEGKLDLKPIVFIYIN